MKKTMYCMRCGCPAELDFGKRWKTHKCEKCGVEFKYKAESEGDYTLKYNTEDLEDLYVGEEQLKDIVAARKEAQSNGAV